MNVELRKETETLLLLIFIKNNVNMNVELRKETETSGLYASLIAVLRIECRTPKGDGNTESTPARMPAVELNVDLREETETLVLFACPC